MVKLLLLPVIPMSKLQSKLLLIFFWWHKNGMHTTQLCWWREKADESLTYWIRAPEIKIYSCLQCVLVAKLRSNIANWTREEVFTFHSGMEKLCGAKCWHLASVSVSALRVFWINDFSFFTLQEPLNSVFLMTSYQSVTMPNAKTRFLLMSFELKAHGSNAMWSL